MTKEEFKKEFSGRLIQAIDTAGYTASGVAAMLGYDDSAMYAYTSSRDLRLPGAFRIREMCELLHISADYLLFGKEEVK